MFFDWTRLGLFITRLVQALFLSRSRQRALPPARLGVPIGRTEDNVEIFFPPIEVEKSGHLALLGASGSGKTTLMAEAVVGEILATAHDRAAGALMVVDPKNDLATGILERLSDRPDLLGRVHYIDPFQGVPFNLAHLPTGMVSPDVRAEQLAKLVATTSASRGTDKALGLGPRQIDLLSHLFLACLTSDDPRRTPLWALDALTVKDGFRALASRTKNRRATAYLLNTRPHEDLVVSAAARIRTAFAATERIERSVRAPGCLSFDELLAPGAIVLVALGDPPGGLLELQKIWANLFVRLAVDHLLERPSPYTGHAARLLLEEAHLLGDVLSDVGEVLLTTGRSRKIGVCILAQGTVLLDAASPRLLEVIMNNVAETWIGRVAAPDALLFARSVAPRSGVVDHIREVQEKTAVTITNLPNRSFLALRPGERRRFTSFAVDQAELMKRAETNRAAIDSVRARYVVAGGDELPRLWELDRPKEIALVARRPPTPWE